MASVSTLQFISVAAVSYLGLLVGFFLASLTREELLTGRKYFPLLQRAIILIIAVVAFDFFSVSLVLRIIAYALLLLLLMLSLNLRLLYAVLGAALFAASKDQNALLIIASLVFLFGIVTGSAYFNPTARKKAIAAVAREMLITNLAYVVIALAFFLAALAAASF